MHLLVLAISLVSDAHQEKITCAPDQVQVSPHGQAQVSPDA